LTEEIVKQGNVLEYEESRLDKFCQVKEIVKHCDIVTTNGTMRLLKA